MTKAMFAGVANSGKSSLKSRIVCWQASSNVRFPRSRSDFLNCWNCFEPVIGNEGRSVVQLAGQTCLLAQGSDLLRSSQFPVLPGISKMLNTLPTPHERKETILVFSPFPLLPSQCHTIFASTMPQKNQLDGRPTNQSESNSKPSTNQTKLVKRKSNSARELKVRVYFIVIQILSFTDWTCCPESSVGPLGWGSYTDSL